MRPSIWVNYFNVRSCYMLYLFFAAPRLFPFPRRAKRSVRQAGKIRVRLRLTRRVSLSLSEGIGKKSPRRTKMLRIERRLRDDSAARPRCAVYLNTTIIYFGDSPCRGKTEEGMRRLGRCRGKRTPRRVDTGRKTVSR